jgi:hypothetical protein
LLQSGTRRLTHLVDIRRAARRWRERLLVYVDTVRATPGEPAMRRVLCLVRHSPRPSLSSSCPHFCPSRRHVTRFSPGRHRRRMLSRILSVVCVSRFVTGAWVLPRLLTVSSETLSTAAQTVGISHTLEPRARAFWISSGFRYCTRCRR